MGHRFCARALAPGGNQLLFFGETYRNEARYQGYNTYGANADGVYMLVGGNVRRLSAPPAPGTNADGNPSYSSGDEQPEPAPGATYVYQHTDCTVYFNSGFLTWADDCGTKLFTAPLAQGAAAASDFTSDCDGTGSTVRDPSADPASASLRVAYGGCSYSADPGNPLVDPQAELVVSGPGQQGQVAVGLGADTCCVEHPSAGFSDPSWSADGNRLVAFNAGGEHQTYNGSGFDTSTVPGGLYVYGDLAHTTGGTLALVAPSDGQGGYEQLSAPRFMGADRIVFVARGSLWSIPAGCDHCVFPDDATKVYDGGAATSTQASGVAWTSQTIEPGSPPGAGGGATSTGRTPSPLPPRPLPPSPAQTRTLIETSRAIVSHGIAKVMVACAGGERGSICRGSLSLAVSVRRRVRRRVHGRLRRVSVPHRRLSHAPPMRSRPGAAVVVPAPVPHRTGEPRRRPRSSSAGSGDRGAERRMFGPACDRAAAGKAPARRIVPPIGGASRTSSSARRTSCCTAVRAS